MTETGAALSGRDVNTEAHRPLRANTPQCDESRPLSAELTRVLARAEYLWAKKYRPDLLKEWVNQ
jgi:hypothetical protein